MHSLLSKLPKVDDCLHHLSREKALASIPRSALKKGVQEFIEQYRQRLLHGDDFDEQLLVPEVLFNTMTQFIIRRDRVRFRRVINGTGVIVHTNLGRSLLPAVTMDYLYQAGTRYSNLEFDLDTGRRGSRYSHVEDLLCELTGAEAGLVVNNNAAAVLIVLETLAKGLEVIVSRGQLVEIGGSFRIPDVMRRSGARLVEVGATNRTHLRDYAEAIGEQTGLLLKVHCSNYRIIGFTREVSNEELVELGHKHDLPVMEDLGSGCLVDLSRFGLMKEPTVQEVVGSGVDVVTFSGDKLLGGPQAGIIVGRKDIIERIKKNPLNRALRIDKFTLSGLESIFRLYRDEQKALQTIPTLAMISAPVKVIDNRARLLMRGLKKNLAELAGFSVIDVSSRVGGGAMPEQHLASRAVRVKPFNMPVSQVERRLRDQEIPLIGRIEDNHFIIDLRTVCDDELSLIQENLANALK